MTENIYIEFRVLILQKGEKTMHVLASLASFLVVIRIQFVLKCNSLLGLLTPESFRKITFKDKFRLSVRFSHLNALRMTQFSIPNFNFDHKLTDNRAAEAFYCQSARSAMSTTKLPNIN